MKLYQGKLEPYLLWLTALNLHSLPRALSSSDYLHLVRETDDVWRSDPDSRCFKLKTTGSGRCYPEERKNCRMVMPYKSLLTCINTTVPRRNELLPPTDSAVYSFSHT